MAYGPTRTRQRFSASPTGLQGISLGQYGPFDTNYENGYSPIAMAVAAPSQSGAPNAVALNPDEGNWWTPQPSIVPGDGMSAGAIAAIVLGALILFGAGARA